MIFILTILAMCVLYSSFVPVEKYSIDNKLRRYLFQTHSGEREREECLMPVLFICRYNWS